MRRSRRTYDELADRLAFGHGSADDSPEIAAFVRLLSQSADDTLTHGELITSLAAEARAIAQDPSGRLHGSTSGSLRRPLWRRRLVLNTFLSTLFGKLVLATTAVAVASAGGLAASGNLPSAAQRWASDTAATVGVTIPRPKTPDESAANAGAARTEGSTRPAGPSLPDSASDKANAVTGTVFDGDPKMGAEFGASVAATASAGKAGGRRDVISSSARSKTTSSTAKDGGSAPSSAQDRKTHKPKRRARGASGRR